MTDIAPQSILGKRSLRDVYNVTPAFLQLVERPAAVHLRLAHRPYATVTEHGQARAQGPPTFPRPHNSEKDPPRAPSPSSSASAPSPKLKTSEPSPRTGTPSTQGPKRSDSPTSSLDDWEQNPDLSISKFSELPGKDFGVNQHMIINEEFKEALRQILWKFRAPIRYAFAYGSGVFPQKEIGPPSSQIKSLHPAPPEAIAKVQGQNPKMIDFIFGVSYTQHWHAINLQEHRDHYSAVGSLGSYAVSKLQDSFGAGVYFNPYVIVNGTLIKYGVVNLDTLCKDLSEWNTLYLAGRLHKPVKILRDNPSVRLANQVNLISAVRTALLLLPPDFTERDLYSTITGISYVGDPRMTIGGDDPRKVNNIVHGQMANFRRLYAPLIDNLPNISFNDSVCSDRSWFDDPGVNAKIAQDMDPVKRGNMVSRLPKVFREKLYFEYQSKFRIPRGEFNEMLKKSTKEEAERFLRREGSEFEQRIARDTEGLKTEVKQVIEKTIRWPSITQSLKGVVMAGARKGWRYAKEKREKALAAAREKG